MRACSQGRATPNALVRSQGVPGAGLALSTCPVSRLSRLFCCVAPSSSSDRAQLLASRRNHRAACSRAGVLGGRGWAVENAAARICREPGGRVTTVVLVRDLDLGAPHVAVDTTLVSALRADGSCRRRAAQHDGVAAKAARQSKARTSPNCGTAPQSSPGCLGARSWWSLVARDSGIHHPIGQGQSSWRNAAGVATHGTGVASLVVIRFGVCTGSGCGFHRVRAAGSSRLRWRDTSSTRGGVGVSVHRLAR